VEIQIENIIYIVTSAIRRKAGLMMGTGQQSTGNSHLLPWEAGKNV